MRLLTCNHRGQDHLGVALERGLLLPALQVDWPDGLNSMLALIDAGPQALARLRQLAHEPPSDATVSWQEVEPLAPIPRPRQNPMCLGLNYADHARETAAVAEQEVRLPEHPIVFTKAVTSVNGPYADIPYEAEISDKLDWEVELGIVIGTGGRKIPVERALEYVFGYTVINDISARDLQRRHKQFYLGKSLTGSCPMGPWIVTADEIPDPQALALECRVNGEVKQASHTARQIFEVATVIAVLSHSMALEAGDIIATGTPSGVGFARNPPEFLRPGDVVECEVEQVGCLRNRVVE